MEVILEDSGNSLKANSFRSGITFHLQRVRRSCSICNHGTERRKCIFKDCMICKRTNTGECEKCVVKDEETCHLCKKQTKDYSFCYIKSNCWSIDWSRRAELSNRDQILAVVCQRCENENSCKRIFTRLSKYLDPSKGLKGGAPMTKSNSFEADKQGCKRSPA